MNLSVTKPATTAMKHSSYLNGATHSAFNESPKLNFKPMSNSSQSGRTYHSAGRYLANHAKKVPICASLSSPVRRSSVSMRQSLEPPQPIVNNYFSSHPVIDNQGIDVQSHLAMPYQTSNRIYYENVDNQPQTEVTSMSYKKDARAVCHCSQDMPVVPIESYDPSHSLPTIASTKSGRAPIPSQEYVQCTSFEEMPQWLANSLPPRHITPVSTSGCPGSYNEEIPVASEVHSIPSLAENNSRSQYAYDVEDRRSTSSPLSNRRLKSSSPPPSRAPRKLPELSRFQYRNADAYKSLEPDDDEAWSTLPSRKKTRKENRPGNVKQSGPFRLPLASLGKNAISESKSNKRAVTYLPPQQLSTDAIIDKKPVTSWIVKRAQHDTRNPLSGEEKAAISIKKNISCNEQRSDPDSDATLVPSSSPISKSESQPTMTLSVSLDSISQAYPELRQNIAEVNYNCFILFFPLIKIFRQ